MISIHPEYVVDEQQHRKAVLLSIGDWGHIVDDLEELGDIRAYDRAKVGNQDSLPFQQAVREIQAEYTA